MMRCDLGKIEAIEHRLPRHKLREAAGACSGLSPSISAEAAGMTSGTFPLVHALRPEKSFAVAPLLQIDGEDDRGTPRRLRALDDRAGDIPNICWIELLPDRRVPRGGHVFDRRGCHGGKNLQMILRASRAGDRDFAFR